MNYTSNVYKFYSSNIDYSSRIESEGSYYSLLDKYIDQIPSDIPLDNERFFLLVCLNDNDQTIETWPVYCLEGKFYRGQIGKYTFHSTLLQKIRERNIAFHDLAVLQAKINNDLSMPKKAKKMRDKLIIKFKEGEDWLDLSQYDSRVSFGVNLSTSGRDSLDEISVLNKSFKNYIYSEMQKSKKD